LWNASFGVHKSFRIKENARLQIFGRATNVFNHPSFGNPNLNITSSSAGVITSVQGGRYDTLGATKRTIRVGFRLDF
jgi:hypothetical protein